MKPPRIHGMGRILFDDYEFKYLRVSQVYPIPGGPALDNDFIREGADLLDANPDLELPPLLVVEKESVVFDVPHWVIDGRHRLQSYMLAERVYIPTLVGTGMIIAPQLDRI
jgi:hypothetical protein